MACPTLYAHCASCAELGHSSPMYLPVPFCAPLPSESINTKEPATALGRRESDAQSIEQEQAEVAELARRTKLCALCLLLFKSPLSDRAESRFSLLSSPVLEFCACPPLSFSWPSRTVMVERHLARRPRDPSDSARQPFYIIESSSSQGWKSFFQSP